MLMPKRVKRRKQFRGSMTGKALRGNKITNGEYGIIAMEPAWIKSNQIEAARIAMTRYIKRGGQVWIKIFPDKPVTTKPAETRMGSGKGSLEYWVAVVKPGRVMFEIAGVTEEIAREALRLASSDHNGLIHLIAYYLADTGFTKISFFHGNSPSCHALRPAQLFALCGNHGLNPCNIPSDFLDPACIIKLVRRVLEP